MREVINFNTKWAFTKEATEVPKEPLSPELCFYPLAFF